MIRALLCIVGVVGIGVLDVLLVAWLEEMI